MIAASMNDISSYRITSDAVGPRQFALYAERYRAILALLEAGVFHPEDRWIEEALRLQAKCSNTNFTHEEIAMVIDLNREILLAEHWRLARFVQPTGLPLHALAAAVGAIKCQATCREYAKDFIGATINDCIQRSDSRTLETIARFTAENRTHHPNFAVWTAIYQMIAESMRTVSAPAECPEITIYRPPDSKEVMDYVFRHRSDPRFAQLQHTDWTKLWVNSGAEVLVRKSTRGPGK